MNTNLKTFVLGILLGSLLSGAGGWAAGNSFYDAKGRMDAPTGSQAQFDYFRLRQQFLDVAAVRKAAEDARVNSYSHPCGK